jgi:hypothetical protein
MHYVIYRRREREGGRKLVSGGGKWILRFIIPKGFLLSKYQLYFL